jgi:hypothetical protein
MHFHNLVFAFVIYVTALLIAQDCRSIALNDRIISEYWIGEDVEGTGRGIIWDVIPKIFLDILRKIMKIWTILADFCTKFVSGNSRTQRKISTHSNATFFNISYHYLNQYTLSFILSICWMFRLISFWRIVELKGGWCLSLHFSVMYPDMA